MGLWKLTHSEEAEIEGHRKPHDHQEVMGGPRLKQGELIWWSERRWAGLTYQGELYLSGDSGYKGKPSEL